MYIKYNVYKRASFPGAAAAEARFLAIDIVGTGGVASRGSVIWLRARPFVYPFAGTKG